MTLARELVAIARAAQEAEIVAAVKIIGDSPLQEAREAAAKGEREVVLLLCPYSGRMDFRAFRKAVARKLEGTEIHMEYGGDGAIRLTW